MKEIRLAYDSYFYEDGYLYKSSNPNGQGIPVVNGLEIEIAGEMKVGHNGVFYFSPFIRKIIKEPTEEENTIIDELKKINFCK